MTKIISCTCQNKYQDKWYGHNKRVANSAGTGSSATWRCTVCSNETPRNDKEK